MSFTVRLIRFLARGRPTGNEFFWGVVCVLFLYLSDIIDLGDFRTRTSLFLDFIGVGSLDYSFLSSYGGVE